jgi:hypothetical protein
MVRITRAAAPFIGIAVSVLLAATPATAQCPNLAAPTNYTVGTNPRQLAVGDVNGDLIADLAVPNYTSNNISILLGTGSGTFGPATNFVAGTNPFAVAIADVDNDGDKDLVSVNYNQNEVAILLGNNTGSFGSGTNFAAGTNPVSAAVADYNGDGAKDLVVANAGTSFVSFLTGTGTGSFSLPTSIAVGSSPQFVISGDFNSDGFADFATANFTSNNVSVVLGNGNGTFGTATNFGAGTNPRSLAVGDFNGDGLGDLAVANENSNNVSVLLRTGAGTFGTAANFAAGTNPYGVVIADFDGDSRNDIASSNIGSNNLTILRGNGTGSFGPATTFAVGSVPYSLVTGLFNGDARVDLAVANFSSNSVSVLLNSGCPPVVSAMAPSSGPAGGFTIVTVTGSNFVIGATTIAFGPTVSPSVNCSSTTQCTAMSPAGSGTVRVLVTTASGASADTTVDDFTYTGPPTTCAANFGAPTNFGTGSAPRWVAIGNFNGDAQPDLAVANNVSNNVSILLGTGPGTFAAATNYAVGANPAYVAIGDFNSDAQSDLVVVNSGVSTFSILPGTGAGTFGAASSFPVGSQPLAVAVGDFDGDSRSDLAFTNGLSSNVSIVLGTGLGTFGPPMNFPVGSLPVSVGIGDFNLDGRSDLAVANQSSNSVSILLGTGTGTFGTATNFAVGATPRSVTVADVSGDGLSDLAVSNGGANNVSILLGTGTGSFGAATNFAVGSNPFSVAIGDMSGDGVSDLAVANNGSNDVSILVGTGTGSFGTAMNVGAGTNPVSVAIADFNGDGRNDLANVNNGSNNVSILLASSCRPVVTSINPTSGPTSGGTVVTITGSNFVVGATSVNFGSTPGAGVSCASTTMCTATSPAGTGTVSVRATTSSGTSANTGVDDFTYTSALNACANFAPATSATAGTEPRAVTVGDFNADGFNDLAVPNRASNNVSILLGSGTGTFAAPTNFAVGIAPVEVAIGDFDGDGNSDLAVANQTTNNVSILMGTGTGSFGTASNFAVGTLPNYVDVADFNGDGRTDVATTNQNSNNVSILLGTGTGSFGSAMNLPVGTVPASLAPGDFNGDGRTDLAVANSGPSNVSILLGTGVGTFGAATNYTAGTNPVSVAVGDFNLDGVNDLAVANASSNNVSILLGSGSGTFSAPTNFAAATEPRSVAIGDFNADGRSDLAVANATSNVVSILVGTGTGAFGAATNLAAGTGAFNVAIGEFNGDGRSDLAVANVTANSISIFLNSGCPPPVVTLLSRSTGPAGGGTLVTITGANFVIGATTVMFGPNAATGVSCTSTTQCTATSPAGSGTVSVRLTTATGTSADTLADNFSYTAPPLACTVFVGPANLPVPTSPFSIATANFNGDPWMDLAVANSGSNDVSILLGTGPGTFGAPANLSIGINPRSVAIGDLNGDGFLDLAVTNFGGGIVTIRFGTGTGTFGSATAVTVGTSPSSVAIGDFNADGKADIAAANQSSNNVSIVLGTGLGAFAAATNYAVGQAPSQVVVGDFNADGRSDLAVTNNTTNDVSILMGTGTGTFGSATSYTAGSSPNSVAVGDLNADGIPDLAVANFGSANASVLIGTGTGSFGSPTNFATGTGPIFVGILDLNGDATLDLAVANQGTDDVSVLFGTGGGSFSTAVNFAAGNSPRSLVISDFNADSRSDLAVANETSNDVSILLNAGCPSVVTAINPSTGPTTGGTIVTITGSNFVIGATSFVFGGVGAPGVTCSSTTQCTATAPSGTGTVSVRAFTASGPSADTEVDDFTYTMGPATTCANFSGPTDFAVGSGPRHMAAGDFNNDGLRDLAVPNSLSANVSILLGSGTGAFGGPTDFPTGSAPISVAVGDFNADGNQDLAVANNTSNNVSILLGTGTGSFGTATNYPTGVGPSLVIVGDFNADARADLAVANFTSNTVSILLGTGTGTFGATADFAGGTNPFSVASGDFNADGRSDLAVANHNSSNVSVLLGTGPGTFGAPASFAVGTNAISVTVADFNGDARSDLAVANYDSANVSVLLGTGTGSFGAASNFAVGVNPYAVESGDFNADGVIDLVTPNTGTNNVSVLIGTGSGTFATAANFATGSGPDSVVVGQFNGDGRNDLAVANYASNNVSILLNATAPGTLSIASGTYSVSEGAGSVTVTVNRTGGTDCTVSVNYATINGSATSGSDYTASSGTLTFGPGIASQTIVIPITDDAVFEGNETFDVLLGGPGGGAGLGSPSTATIIINENETQPSLSINSVSQAETNSGTTNFSFNVTLSGPSAQTVLVDYATADQTAVAGSDYTATSGKLTLLPGSVTGVISVSVFGDTTFEGSETFTVNLSAPVNATIATGTGTGTILNDDAVPSLAIDSVTQAEGNSGTTNFVFTVTLAGATDQPVTVDYATADGTASGSDYTATSGTLTFAPGESIKTITVSVIGDASTEPDETFTVALTAPTNATITTGTGIGTIQNDEGLPTLAITGVSQAEGNSGTTNFVFGVTLTGSTSQAVTVNYTSADGTAAAGSDYIATSGTLTFAPGESSKTITVSVTGDATTEADETFTVALSASTNAAITTGTATGTILNDEGVPTLAIAGVSQAEGNSGTSNFVLSVTLTGSTSQVVTVNYATADGTAAAGSDYIATSGTLTFAPGESSKTITVSVTGDATPEPSETFTVALSAPTNAVITTGTGTGTIQNDDAPSVASFSPASGSAGTVVTINGTGFTGTTAVTFNGVSASFTVASDTQLTATVPAGATTGPIVVTAFAASGSSASSFTVNVCSSTATVTASGPTTFCSGGSVTLSANTGTSYLWSTGATSQSITVSTSGSYSVTVTSGSCSATSAPVTVTVNPSPTVAISGPAASCQSGSPITLTASGSNIAGLLWSTGATTSSITVSPTATTTYSVTATSASGCTASASQRVVVGSTAPIAISAPSSVQPGSSSNAASVAGGAPTDVYSWTITNGTITGGQGTTSITFSAGSSGAVGLAVSSVSGACSSTASATVPIIACSTTPPSLTAPADGATDFASPVTFSWTSVPTATSYELYVSPDGGAESLLATTTATTVTVSVPSGVVRWYVIARQSDTCNTLLKSGVRGFTVKPAINCPTGAPTPVSPVPGARVFSPVTFRWSPVEGATGYHVVVFSASGAVDDLGVVDKDRTSILAPVTAGDVRWQVSALYSGCPEVAAAPVSFGVDTEDCSKHGVAALLTPSAGSTLPSSTVNFTWTAVEGADGYRVWTSVDGADFAAIGETADTKLTATSTSGRIEWFVESLFEGCPSTESAHATFIVPSANNCGSTQAPALLSPAADVTTAAASVTFSWSNVGALEYELYLSVGDGTPILVTRTTATSFATEVPRGVIDWYVRALFNGCPTLQSATRRFTYEPPPQCATTAPQLISPLEDTFAIPAPITFRWSAVPTAASYRLTIVIDGGQPIVINTTSTQANSVSVPSGVGSWSVEALFAGGCPITSSSARTLVVVPTSAQCAEVGIITLAGPSQISPQVPYTMVWRTDRNATEYTLQEATTATFADATNTNTTGNVANFIHSNLSSAPITFFYRVRGVNTRCTPVQNGPWSATVGVVVLPQATPINETAEASALISETKPIDYTIPLGAELAGQTFSATPTKEWLTVTPSSGTVPAGGTSLRVTADATVLPLGTSTGGVVIALSGAPSITTGVRKASNAGSTVTNPVNVSLVTPVVPNPKSTPPPDALIIPAVAHADAFDGSRFQSDVRITNTSPQVMRYQLTFTPTGENGLSDGKQAIIDIEPSRTVAMDDVLRTWFGSGTASVLGSLEIRPLTKSSNATSSSAIKGLGNFVTFASSRSFNMIASGTFGQQIPAIPFANFIARGSDPSKSTVLSLQQIAQSANFRTNLGFVEGSGTPADLLVTVFGDDGKKMTDFTVALAGGQHLQLGSFLAQRGMTVKDGRIEVKVTSPGGKVTAYASVLDNKTNDSLLVTPIALTDAGVSKYVLPGVAELSGGIPWQTDVRLFNASDAAVATTLTFQPLNSTEAITRELTLAAGEVRQLDRVLPTLFGVTNDGGALHITTVRNSNLIATARTYRPAPEGGTFGQFISAVTPNDAVGVGNRPLQLLQIEQSERYRSNVGIAEVNGRTALVEVSVIAPDSKVSRSITVPMGPNQVRQLNSLLQQFGLSDTYNARVTVKVIEGQGKVTAYVSVIDNFTADPTFVPAQ